MALTQQMIPDRRVRICGSTVEFRLSGVPDGEIAFVRTNLGMARVHRREFVEALELEKPAVGRDWHDIPMTSVGFGVWKLTLPLLEIGGFSAKCFSMREKRMTWADGDNFQMKVEPPHTVGANLIYSAFVRQFGPNLCRAERDRSHDGAYEQLNGSGGVAIPRSGTFRDLIREVDFILNKLGFQIIQLLPVHPVPVSFGRMGLFGSPFAAVDYFSVDPQLAEFDTRATPIDQFVELVDAVHAEDGRLFMDIPVNHTGWGSVFQNNHPEWFVHDESNAFVSPGAWGVVWSDLCKLDYSPEVTRRMADVFLFWCSLGVDGFRCDAGYMIPKSAWDYIVARVRLQYPLTVFLLEGLGGPPATQERLLGDSGLNWAYSEIFQNYDRGQIEYYYNYLAGGHRRNGLLVNYAETHDNPRLAATGKAWSRQRCEVAALLSDAGAFGITNGVEFYAVERVDVHLDSGLNWGAADNQVEHIARLNRLLSVNPCFRAGAEWEFVHTGSGNILAVLRKAEGGKKFLLCLFNLDREKTQAVTWRATPLSGRVVDLLSGREFTIDASGTLSLEPCGTLVLSGDPDDFAALSGAASGGEPDMVSRQRLSAAALMAWAHFHRNSHLDFKPSALADLLFDDVDGFIRTVSGRDVGACVHYALDADLRRQVMVFRDGILAVRCPDRFEAKVSLASGAAVWFSRSMKLAGGDSFCFLYFPLEAPSVPQELTISFAIFGSGGVRRCRGTLLLLPCGDAVRVKMAFTRHELLRCDRYALLANNLGGYSQVKSWTELHSKYDAILAANCNSDFPVDRQVMFTRCRSWMVFRDYSFSLDIGCMDIWSIGFPNATQWRLTVPVGQGMTVSLVLQLRMAEEGNAIRLTFRRLSGGGGHLPDSQPVKIIVRPDVEDRVNHTVTKAFTGAEQRFPQAVLPFEDGFSFQPGERRLTLRMPGAKFVSQPEWSYMVDLPRERYYGLECATDLFSPGYLEFQLAGGTEAELEGEVVFPGSVPAKWGEKPGFPPDIPLPEALRRAVDVFVVKRDTASTVIAGYPWFLDWGRDTLICLRGLIAAGKLTEAAGIVRKFATFEQNGTIPNMIHGMDVSNRDTSDAPLWLIVAVKDMVAASGNDQIMIRRCGKRRLQDILLDIVANYRSGTPNGIAMDEASGLIFSPSHFTWMDTNYPAASPREGYPVEIQALWYAALNFLSGYDASLGKLADRVRDSLMRYFRLDGDAGYSDCLHCSPGVPAARAVRDNAVRPNQLLAVTLGAVTDRGHCLAILRSAEKLLIPGAIRSLADAPVTPPLPVYWRGALLNDPDHPYRGVYRGSEDTERKVAYHNGTAWCWPFPLYVEALYMLGGEAVKSWCVGYLNSARTLMSDAVPWQLPEVADGDWPHRWGGCGAQAWSATEFLRVWTLLNR
ncbi:MAG: amylo-alpha-1,6-glucosidase [Victivallaceae bacterium]|nr:amylo-alpha-1,6-glucosidase [Victivallaceae bacterium]